MARDTRASANAVAAAADMNEEEEMSPVKSAKALKREAPSTETSPPNNKRRRGVLTPPPAPHSGPATASSPPGNGSNGVNNGATPGASSLKTKIVIPPTRIIKLVVKGKGIDTKDGTQKVSGIGQETQVGPVSSGPPPARPNIASAASSTNGHAQGEGDKFVSAGESGVGSVAMSRGGSGAASGSGSGSGSGTSYYSAEDTPLGISRREKESLLSILTSMEQYFAASTNNFVGILDLPLQSSPSNEPLPEPVAVEPKPRGRPKKNKGKDKETEGEEPVLPTGDEITLRSILRASDSLNVADLMTYMHAVAQKAMPHQPNPFPEAVEQTGVTMSTPSGVRRRDSPTATENLLISVLDVIRGLNPVLAASKPYPTVTWGLHQRLPGSGNTHPSNGIAALQDWFSGAVTSREAIPKGEEHIDTNGEIDTAHGKVGKPGVGRRALRSAAPAAPVADQGGDIEMADATIDGEEDRRIARAEDLGESGVLSKLSSEGMSGFADPITIDRGDHMTGNFASPANKLFIDQPSYSAYYGQALPSPASQKTFPTVPPITLSQNLLSMASKRVRSYRANKEASFGPGWVGKPVKGLHMPNSFTPTFAPSLDSSETTGGWGYDSSYRAARTRAASRAWAGVGWGATVGREWASEQKAVRDEGEPSGMITIDKRLSSATASNGDNTRTVIAQALGSAMGSVMDIDPSLVEAVDEARQQQTKIQTQLNQNAEWMQELQAWQDIRVRRGQAEVVDEREADIASKLATSLQEIAGWATPASLLPPSMAGSAHLATTLANQIIATPSAVLRGTLDPDRRHALVDNTTVEVKPYATGHIGAPSAYGTVASPVPIPVPASAPSVATPTLSRAPPPNAWYPPSARHTPTAHPTPSPAGYHNPPAVYPPNAYTPAPYYPSPYPGVPPPAPYGTPYGPAYGQNGYANGYSPSPHGSYAGRGSPGVPNPGYAQPPYQPSAGRTVQNSRSWAVGPASPAPGGVRGIGASMGMPPHAVANAMRAPSSLR